MKNIHEILKYVDTINLINKDIENFRNIHFDSRKVEQNDMFIAVKGTQTDGHEFINDVIARGANVIVCENLPENPSDSCCWVVVEDSSVALAKIADAFYNFPSKKIKLVGVTGTNGKTTIATSLYRLVRALGYKAGLLSTIKNLINDKEIPATHTTSDAITINKMLSQMLEAGCEFCFMEVSSHAIHQNRVASLNFVGGIFTNLTHDHLDYHKTFKDYLYAKKAFFDVLPKEAFALVNADDKNAKLMLQNTKAKKLDYSTMQFADYKTKILEHHFEGMLLKINNTEVWVKLIGKFNASNITAIYASAIQLGFNQNEVLKYISLLSAVEGRFETIRSDNGITAIVDYAHTPDALENVLQTITEIIDIENSIITVVGAGGNRDKTKRPIMAQIAAKYSDKLILTSDNPRNEDPQVIINDMLEGFEDKDKNRVLTNINRKEAIRIAVMLAKSNDVILVAGKGHETYQEIEGVRHHFDDKEIINEIFKSIC
ncbi:MAG TPA: UDP-N-acetylmuramoyl-L-alanyl-D-glutamate--2,6-diaminopimelate ligase [Bacteroidales bacterium]|jgi:UDP-N-acetylmuramoyl-L-alanyl-D-glutamate--2,6-diaminopimelate ligase|nr:UDP-N-acetylmuramoyl-L-alanyl-D-glutamate--2,6-diaminopimelate ligase [Bacteroidales bacterium]HXK81291.1 UDP-N-acetylmuramoyl-L-alanyl-D-glutamate--2,6-diaminopimelate ligase [Bacteroidales bacterium]